MAKRKSSPSPISTGEPVDPAIALQLRVQQWATHRDRGKKAYQKAGEILRELMQTMQPGQVVDLGDGRRATLKDKFAGSRSYVREEVYVNRYELEIST